MKAHFCTGNSDQTTYKKHAEFVTRGLQPQMQNLLGAVRKLSSDVAGVKSDVSGLSRTVARMTHRVDALEAEEKREEVLEGGSAMTHGHALGAASGQVRPTPGIRSVLPTGTGPAVPEIGVYYALYQDFGGAYQPVSEILNAISPGAGGSSSAFAEFRSNIINMLKTAGTAGKPVDVIYFGFAAPAFSTTSLYTVNDDNTITMAGTDTTDGFICRLMFDIQTSFYTDAITKSQWADVEYKPPKSKGSFEGWPPLGLPQGFYFPTAGGNPGYMLPQGIFPQAAMNFDGAFTNQDTAGFSWIRSLIDGTSNYDTMTLPSDIASVTLDGSSPDGFSYFSSDRLFDGDSIYDPLMVVTYKSDTSAPPPPPKSLFPSPLHGTGAKRPLLVLSIGGWTNCTYKYNSDGSLVSPGVSSPTGGLFEGFVNDTSNTRFLNGEYDVWARQVIYQARIMGFDGLDLDFEFWPQTTPPTSANALNKILAALTNPANLGFDKNSPLTMAAFNGWPAYDPVTQPTASPYLFPPTNWAYPTDAKGNRLPAPNAWDVQAMTGVVPVSWTAPYISVTLPGWYAKVGSGLLDPDLGDQDPVFAETRKYITWSTIRRVNMMLYDSGPLTIYDPRAYAHQFLTGVPSNSYFGPNQHTMPCGLTSLPPVPELAGAGSNPSILGFGLEIVAQATSDNPSNLVYPYTMDGCVGQTLAAYAAATGMGEVFIWYYDAEAFAVMYPQIIGGFGLGPAADGQLIALGSGSNYMLSSMYEYGPISLVMTGPSNDPFKPLHGELLRPATVTPSPSGVDLVLAAAEIPAADLEARTRKFLWGAGTSAFQIEGNLTADGRGPSIWDAFIPSNDTTTFYPDLACNSYYQYKDDIRLLASKGAKAYRFSIAWSRIIPGGTLYSDCEGTVKDPARVNALGLAHYNKVIDACKAHGLEPLVTLYHWDLPQALQDAYSGWLCTAKYAGTDEVKVVSDFRNYADVCFAAFGDRVKFWATINEPQTICIDCYEYNWYAPGAGTADGVSPSGAEYAVAKNLLLAHAAAYRQYDRVYRADQRGAVGIVCNMDCGLPYDDTKESEDAAQRANEFWGGWFWDPIFFGQYPASMLQLVPPSRLPPLTEAESAAIRGTMDVFLWNTYSANLIQDVPVVTSAGWAFDSKTNPVSVDPSGFTIGVQGESTWLHSVPEGAAAGLRWIQNRYSGPSPSAPGAGRRGAGIRLFATDSDRTGRPLALMVTENGFDVANEDIHTSEATAVADIVRWHDFYTPYLKQLHSAAAATGTRFAGYFAWALMDNLEWSHGFNNRFGLSYINFMDATGKPLQHGGPDVKLARVPKQSFSVLEKLMRD